MWNVNSNGNFNNNNYNNDNNFGVRPTFFETEDYEIDICNEKP
jgi:hypothetical protein